MTIHFLRGSGGEEGQGRQNNVDTILGEVFS